MNVGVRRNHSFIFSRVYAFLSNRVRVSLSVLKIKFNIVEVFYFIRIHYLIILVFCCLTSSIVRV